MAHGLNGVTYLIERDAARNWAWGDVDGEPSPRMMFILYVHAKARHTRA